MRRGLILVGFLFASVPAQAQPAGGPPDPATAPTDAPAVPAPPPDTAPHDMVPVALPPPDDGGGHGKKHKKKDKHDQRGQQGDRKKPHRQHDQLEFGGRVFVLDQLTGVDLAGQTAWHHDRSLSSARAFFAYSRGDLLKFVLEVEFGKGRAQGGIKDGFVRITPTHRLRIQAGQFKRPVSFIGLESSWSLPTIGRGLLSDFNAASGDGLPFVGSRAVGVAVAVKPDLPLKPSLTLAAFQSDIATRTMGIEVTGCTLNSPKPCYLTDDLFLRLELRLARGWKLGSTLGWVGVLEQAGSLDSYNHRAFGSLELYGETPWLRLWAEGFAGKDEQFYRPDGTLAGTFWAARAIVAPRIDKPVHWMVRAEPFVQASILDPSNQSDRDRVTEVGAGLSMQFSRAWRLQLDGARRLAQGLESPEVDSTVFRLQLGAAFRD